MPRIIIVAIQLETVLIANLTGQVRSFISDLTDKIILALVSKLKVQCRPL